MKRFITTLLPATLLAGLVAACGGRATYVAGAVLDEGAPIVVLQGPAELRIYEQSGMATVTVDNPVTAPPEEWRGVARAAYEAFRDEFGDGRVTLLSAAESRRLLEERRSGSPYPGWAEHDGAIAVVVEVRGGFLRTEAVSDRWTYHPELGTLIDFWRVDPDAPGALLVYGSMAASAWGMAEAERFEGPALTTEEALETFDVREHRDALEEATRREVETLIAEMRAQD